VKVIDNETGWKVDLIVRKDRPFSEAEFERRVPVDCHEDDCCTTSNIERHACLPLRCQSV